MTIKLGCIVAAASLLLAACSDGGGNDGPTRAEDSVVDTTPDGPDDPQESEAPGGFGTYAGTTAEGADVEISLPPDEDHADDVAEVESVRETFEALGADIGAVSYATVTVDNTGGDEQTFFSEFSVVTADGDTVRFEPVWILVGDWQDLLVWEDDPEIDAAFSEATRVYNAHLDDGTDALPGARGTGLYAANADLESPARVFLQDARQLEPTG